MEYIDYDIFWTSNEADEWCNIMSEIDDEDCPSLCPYQDFKNNEGKIMCEPRNKECTYCLDRNSGIFKRIEQRRKIRYRIYDKIENEMFYCDDITQYSSTNYIIMKSTGFKDRDSDEVFEGDVVCDGNCFYIVEWYDYENKFIFSTEYDEYVEALYEYQIAGNIYENTMEEIEEKY